MNKEIKKRNKEGGGKGKTGGGHCENILQPTPIAVQSICFTGSEEDKNGKILRTTFILIFFYVRQLLDLHKTQEVARYKIVV